jgi:hypothetical protein
MPKGDNPNPEAGAAAVRGGKMAEIRAAAAERRERVRKLIKAGYTIPEVAKQLDIRQQKVATDILQLRKAKRLRKSDVVPAEHGPRRKNPNPTSGARIGRPPKYEAKRAVLLARVSDGEEYTEVARDLEVAYSTAYNWVNRAGLFDEDNRHTTAGRGPEATAKWRRFLTLLADGWPKSHAALEVQISETTATRWAREAGLQGHRVEGANRPPDPKPFVKLPDLAKRAVEHPEVMAREYLGLADSWAPWMSMTLERLLELYHSPRDEYVCLNAHPGSGKTTVVTYAFCAWAGIRERALGEEPTFSLGHDVEAKAKNYVKRLRTLFTHNSKLINDFGRFRPESNIAPWSASELLIEPLEWQALREKEPTYTAQAYRGSVLSGRYRIVIWDDLVSRENSRTKDQREELERWLVQEAENRLNAGGLFALSNARYGPEDLSHYVLSQVDVEEIDFEGEPRPLYTHIAFPAHDDSRCKGTEHDGPWPDGCLLNPKLASWRRLRHFMVQSEDRYRLVWQQEDTDVKGFLAERTWFDGGVDRHGVRRIGCLDMDRRFGQVPEGRDSAFISAVTVDPSSSHFWAIEHWLVYGDGAQVLLRGMRRVLKAPDLLYTAIGGWQGILEDWWIAHPFTYLIVEHNAAQKHMLQYPFFSEWCAARGVTLVPHTTTINRTDPDLGVEMLAPIYREGLARLPYAGVEEKVFADAFRREACAWPEGSTTDLVMAHWFLNHRLRNLLAFGPIVAPGETMAPDAPEWIDHGVPSWAAERMGPPARDRGLKVLTG